MEQWQICYIIDLGGNDEHELFEGGVSVGWDEVLEEVFLLYFE